MASLEYLSSWQSGGHGSTTSQNLRQSLGFHTFPVSKSSAPITKQSNLRQESAQLRKRKQHLCLIQLLWLWRPLTLKTFFCLFLLWSDSSVREVLKIDGFTSTSPRTDPLVHRRSIGFTWIYSTALPGGEKPLGMVEETWKNSRDNHGSMHCWVGNGRKRRKPSFFWHMKGGLHLWQHDLVEGAQVTWNLILKLH